MISIFGNNGGARDTAYTDLPSDARLALSKDEEILTEIRDRYKNYDQAWAKIREERNTDLKYIAGDPWSAEDRRARKDAGRPCINHDELGQYVFQTVNTMRQNNRGIKVDPRGAESNEETATLRQDLIRTIEYDSDGPSIYAKAYQDMVEGSYSFFRISRRYVTDQYAESDKEDPQGAMRRQSRNKTLFDQIIVLKPIANPNSVLFDPTCKEPDWSDGKACFVLERMPKKEFRRRFPKARITDFSWAYREIASEWIRDDDVLVAEYWRIETEERTIYLLENGEVTDDLRGRDYEEKRTLEEKSVHQYITNGVEILDHKKEIGTILPIIPMVGLERYLDEGGSSARVLFSLARLARDPQMSLAYLNSLEMEEAGLTPKTPYIGYKGMFDSGRKMWETVTKIPYAFLEVDIPDNWPAGQVPPLPMRTPFAPNFQAYEVAKDSCRRAIQAAMGISPLPTAAQRSNEKSGVALQRIETEEALGSYHFIDGYDRALRLAGRVIDQWIPAVYNREDRKIHLRKADESYRAATLNTRAPYTDAKTGKQAHYPVEEIDHSISISTGPSYASQHDAVSQFLDNLIAQLPKLPIAAPQAAQLLAIAIRMKEMGPLGDQMADIISPSQGSSDQAMQQLQQAQGQVQQMGLLIQQLQAELQKLQIEKQGKVVEGEYKMQTERLRAQSHLIVEKLKADAQLAAAEIDTKAQSLSERTAAIEQLFQQAHEQLDDASARMSDQAHERNLAAQQHQQDMVQAQQAHEHAMAQAQQAGAISMQQAAQQAANEPQTQEGQQ